MESTRTNNFALLFAVFIAPAAMATNTELYPDKDRLVTLPRELTLHILGKYRGLVENEFELWEVPLAFRVHSPALAKKVLSLHPDRDNVKVTGELKDEADGKTVFHVVDIETVKDDASLFTDELKAAFGRPDRRSIELFRIARTIRKLERFDEKGALQPLLVKAVYEGYRLAQRKLDPKDAIAHLRLLHSVYRQVPDRTIFSDLLRREALRFPESPEFASRLTKLGFRFVQGRWLEYREFKKREGFVRYNGIWVKEHDREFLEYIKEIAEANRTNLILRAKTDRGYKQLAESGTVERGMKREEVATASGFPDRVRRRRLKTLVFDQWDYGESRVYLLNGLVYDVKHDPEAAPAGGIHGR